MLLALDVGNTKISVGIFEKSKLTFKRNIDTIINNHYDILSINLVELFANNNINHNLISSVIISSVVPSIDKILELSLSKILQNDINILHIGDKNIILNLKILLNNSKEVGHDRIVNSISAINKYGKNLIIVDFGSAITIDIINNNYEYIGGFIMPGINMSLLAMHEYTAKLPHIKFNKPYKLIGNSTKSAILSGIYYSNYYAIKNIINEISEEMKCKMTVIFTGGNSSIYSDLAKKINAHFEPDLCLNGLNIIYNNNL